MLAPEVAQAIATLCAEAYVPATGENVGVATVSFVSAGLVVSPSVGVGHPVNASKAKRNNPVRILFIHAPYRVVDNSPEGDPVRGRELFHRN